LATESTALGAPNGEFTEIFLDRIYRIFRIFFSAFQKKALKLNPPAAEAFRLN